MNPIESLNESALCDGLAEQMAAWAKRAGATARVQARVRNASLALTRATRAGHVCLPLADLGADVDALRSDLLESGVVQAAETVGTALSEHTLQMPLVLDRQHRLYLHRDYVLERQLAQDLLRLAPGLRVLSGGPGTGKTTRMVQWLVQELKSHPACRFALAAPTGKAAARMAQALAASAEFRAAGLQQDLASSPALTLHRLLGAQGGGRFSHGARKPLALDLLVIDEASMLDLNLAAQTLQALRTGAQLWLLGDAYQLAAVEAGAVFADIVGEHPANPLLGHRQRLAQQHRFDPNSAMARLAQAVNGGKAAEALALAQAGDEQLHWSESPQAGAAPGTWRAALQAAQQTYLREIQGAAPDARLPAIAHAALRRFRLLCALREGPFGANTYNKLLDQRALSQEGHDGRHHHQGPFYSGRPVMVLRNDSATERLNGDVGIALRDRNGLLMVHFERGDGGFEALAPSRLPPHESAWASTVHKAQGSEFDTVFLLLPPAPSRALSREGLYTGLTRAKRQLFLCAPVSAVAAAVAQSTRRRSGLLDRLMEGRETSA